MSHIEVNPIQSAKNARLIIAARLISDFGAFLNMVALSTYVYVISNSVMSVGVFLASRVSGGILASLLGTAFYRRWRGKLPLICFDLLRASLLGLLLFLPATDQPILLPLIAFGIGLGNAMFAIGLNNQMPNLVHSEQLVTTNAWIASVSATGAVAGSLVSGLLVASSGYSVVFAANVVTYLLAAVCILPLEMSKTVATIRPAKHHNEQHGEWQILRQGLRATPVLACMLLVTMADTLGSAAHNVGLPIFSKLLTPDAVSTTMGLLLATWAIGKFVGARLASYLLRLSGEKLFWMERLFFIGVFLMSGSFILVFQQQSMLYLLLFAVPAGLGDGLAEVALLSRLQQESDTLRLPIFSLLTLFQMTGFGIGMLISAPFYNWLAPGIVVLLFHGIPLMTMLMVFIVALALKKTSARDNSLSVIPTKE